MGIRVDMKIFNIYFKDKTDKMDGELLSEKISGGNVDVVVVSKSALDSKWIVEFYLSNKPAMLYTKRGRPKYFPKLDSAANYLSRIGVRSFKVNQF